VTPARWLTPTGLAWAAAAITTILAFAAAVLAVLGRDVSILLVPAPLTYAWMGAVLLFRPLSRRFPGRVMTGTS